MYYALLRSICFDVSKLLLSVIQGLKVLKTVLFFIDNFSLTTTYTREFYDVMIKKLHHRETLYRRNLENYRNIYNTKRSKFAENIKKEIIILEQRVTYFSMLFQRTRSVKKSKIEPRIKSGFSTLPSNFDVATRTEINIAGFPLHLCGIIRVYLRELDPPTRIPALRISSRSHFQFLLWCDCDQIWLYCSIFFFFRKNRNLFFLFRMNCKCIRSFDNNHFVSIDYSIDAYFQRYHSIYLLYIFDLPFNCTI